MLATIDNNILQIENDLQATIYNMLCSPTPIDFSNKLKCFDEQLNQQIGILDMSLNIDKIDRKNRIIKIQIIQGAIDKAIKFTNPIIEPKRRGRPPKKQVETKPDIDIDHMNNIILEQTQKLETMEETNRDLMENMVKLIKENTQQSSTIKKLKKAINQNSD